MQRAMSARPSLKGMWDNTRANPALGGDKSFFSSGNDELESQSLGSSKSRPSLFNMQKQQSTASLLGTKESRTIWILKMAVFFVIFLAVCAVAAATYVNLTAAETNNFEEAFAGNAGQIVSLARQKATQLFSALDVLSTIISSKASATNSRWPLIYVPDWSIHAEKLGHLMGDNIQISFAPIVLESQRELWANYSQEAAPIWYQESIDYEGVDVSVDDLMAKTLPYTFYYDFRNGFSPTRVATSGLTLPVWHSYPLLKNNSIPVLMDTNLDLLTTPFATNLFNAANATKSPVIGVTQVLTDDKSSVAEGSIMQPVFQKAGRTNTLVGVALLQLKWIDYFKNLLLEGNDGIVTVLRSTCPYLDNDGTEQDEEIGLLSYEINGPNVTFLGEFDAHDPDYEYLGVSERLIDLQIDTTKLPPGTCVPTLNLHIYPTSKLADSFKTTRAALYTTGAVLVFAFTSAFFLIYDYFVRRRQRKVMKRIAKQELIVSNVFPTAFRDRIYQDEGAGSGRGGNDDGSVNSTDPSSSGKPGTKSSAPIADLFPNTSIIFADIAGFTAWSSAREPQDVFTLLEKIYAAFDKVVHRYGIFKVETVGDCYVAVAGIPDPIEKHAVVAAKFARECMKKMQETVLKLEVTLGPDTAELDLRIGIHSGQVTAGVLRGERSRFQLFGDTVNMASRMESNGLPGRIQLSKETADLLIDAGLSAWVAPRRGRIYVKGKGEMQTFWIRKRKLLKLFRANSMDLTAIINESSETGELERDDEDDDILDGMNIEEMDKTDRLVEWNVDVLASLLQQIIASREGSTEKQLSHRSLLWEENMAKGKTVLDEFKPIIPLKRFDADELKIRRRPSSIEIGEAAKSQLRTYLASIASMYQDNPFHNFEHASHVTASVKKLLTRIVSVNDQNKAAFGGQELLSEEKNLVDLAGHSYGITSDPLTQFAVVFSAIIHDVDHPGVPNVQLVKESTRNAQIYGKSIAEQNSVDLAWEMLMQDEYQDLRACIYQTEDDLKRFRQLVVNTVLATDIVDKELQALRKARWEGAFSGTINLIRDVESEDRKATIVIEHLIQASDVVHTMQHWHIYKSWNEKFFCECYKAYKSGRADVDPSVNWYKGEIGFFDFYVIPLAKKLDECGVFGVSSHEYLNYARANREEWVREGENIVKSFVEGYLEKENGPAEPLDSSTHHSLRQQEVNGAKIV